MNIEEIIEKLHPLETKILPLIEEKTKRSKLEQTKENIEKVEVARAIGWLENKEIITTEETIEKQIKLAKNGKKYKKNGLPEKKLLKEIQEKDLNFSNIQEKTKLEEDEINASIGRLRKKQTIEITDGNIQITEKGKNKLETGFLEENFLQKKFPIKESKLDKKEKHTYEELKERKNILEINKIKDKTIKLTEKGKKVKKELENTETKEQIGEINSQILENKEWKNKEFRSYDVISEVPPKTTGKKHIITQALDQIRKIWLELGFEELEGNMIQSTFWNMDALFIPQDHPARDMQDTIFVEGKQQIENKEVKEKVKKSHEQGIENSKGWEYTWNEEEAQKKVMRTHTTCLSAQKLSQLEKEDLPKKYFSIGKVFRNETTDATHLQEFYQLEGIVIDENLNLKNLKDYLNKFYQKMGYDNVRIRPAYFPYTEPSCEIEVYDEEKNEWIELGGAGIFRPEVTQPLFGEDITVLAWGLGLGRIISPYYQIKDIRKLYENNIKELQQTKNWIK